MCSLQRLNFCILLFLPLNNRVEMSSIFINTPSSSSSMKCTYPPTNKPSKQELKHGNCKPTWNKRTHPFVLRSSLHSLRLGRRCRHYGSLHSQVRLFIISDLLVCGYIVFHETSICGFVFNFCVWFCVQRLCVVFDINIWVSLSLCGF